MVNLRIIMEGQAATSDMALSVAENAESLRQSIHAFFSRVLDTDDINVSIFMGNGYRNAAKRYIERPEGSCLYVDSDYPYTDREKWHDRLLNPKNPEKNIVIPTDMRGNVYFMIQEMEAWFLKQLECLPKWAAKAGFERVDEKDDICQHSLLRGKDVEDIKKPSKALAILIRKYYRDPLTKRACKYGKMDTAPGLLDALDAKDLIPKDRELARFVRFHSCRQRQQS